MENMEQYNQGQQYQQSIYRQNPQQQYQQPQYQQPQNPYPARNITVSDPNYGRDILVSILQIFVTTIFFGFVPLIFRLIAHSYWKKGDYETYQKRLKVANICMTIGWVIIGIEAAVVLLGIIYLFYAMVTSGF